MMRRKARSKAERKGHQGRPIRSMKAQARSAVPGVVLEAVVGRANAAVTRPLIDAVFFRCDNDTANPHLTDFSDALVRPNYFLTHHRNQLSRTPNSRSQSLPALSLPFRERLPVCFLNQAMPMR